MQGRLSEMIDGKIQAFPYDSWINEYPLANSCGFSLMEWTLDADRLWNNPLMSTEGRRLIEQLSKANRVNCPSVTADCFMQEPFWNFPEQKRMKHEETFWSVCNAASTVGMKIIVLPLVDFGRPCSPEAWLYLTNFLSYASVQLVDLGLQVALELDLPPQEVSGVINQLPTQIGINYDIGNSAAAGFSPSMELSMYGPRVLNVHVKDRVLGGTTVPLGHGAANFDVVFSKLIQIGYDGNFILQTARSQKHEHREVLIEYRDFVLNKLSAKLASNH
jgi:hexulose-6-phosphate isomerase